MREAVARVVAIDPAGGQPRGREVRPVGRVGPCVRFEADGIGLPIKPAALSGSRTVKKVSGVDLQARLIGEELEYAAGCRLGEPRGETWLAGGRAKTEIVVVAAADAKLRMVIANSRADRGTWSSAAPGLQQTSSVSPGAIRSSSSFVRTHVSGHVSAEMSSVRAGISGTVATAGSGPPPRRGATARARARARGSHPDSGK